MWRVYDLLKRDFLVFFSVPLIRDVLKLEMWRILIHDHLKRDFLVLFLKVRLNRNVSGFEMWQVDKDPSVETLKFELDPLVLQRVIAVIGHSLGSTVQVLEPEV